jgi:hypothetical protein
MPMRTGMRDASARTHQASGRAKILGPSASALRCRRKFLRFFPGGFADETYVDWERGYKWDAHRRWEDELGQARMLAMLKSGQHARIAATAVAMESRTNLLFSFEKMAVRDAVKPPAGARAFAEGLYAFLHRPLGGERGQQDTFDRWCEVLSTLPRRQTRVLTWPVATVFGFLAAPRVHVFLKPRVTATAARLYGYDFRYQSRPGWETYGSLMGFARRVRRDVADLRPRDMIDVQSFLWVQGSEEYDE